MQILDASPGKVLAAVAAVGLGLLLYLNRQRVWRSPATRQNAVIVLMLLASLYLGIAAIVAIPELHSTNAPESTEVTADQLKARLDAALIHEDSLNAAFPYQPFTVDPIEGYLNVTDTQSSASAEGQEKTTPAVRSAEAEVWQQLVAGLTPARQLRRQRIGDYQAMRRFLLTQQHDAEAAAVTEFRVNADRKGVRERARHFLALEHWFRGRQSLVLWTRLRPCLGALREMEGIWETWAANQALIAKRAAGRIRAGSPPAPGADSLRPPFADRSVLIPLIDARSICGGGAANILPNALEQPPPRPPLGGDLGPFSLIALWLVRTESLPLALITGMLGFGLLGATVSTALHERAVVGTAGAAGKRPLVEDLAGVLLRGFSAAIVVFLAVESGLAVFESSGADPNPYVLLFTCFVAAAFSSDVWDWAHQALLDRLKAKASQVDAVSVAPAAATVQVGRSVQLAATVVDASGDPVDNAAVAWSTSDAATAEVAPATGQVTGVAAGSANVVATARGKQGSAAITVT
jgi:hypothetical protein